MCYITVKVFDNIEQTMTVMLIKIEILFDRKAW